MTRAAALAEARRRWGDAGRVRTHRVYALGNGIDGRVEYLVGTLNNTGWNPRQGVFRSRGMGWTWEAAFADADARGATRRSDV